MVRGNVSQLTGLEVFRGNSRSLERLACSKVVYVGIERLGVLVAVIQRQFCTRLEVLEELDSKFIDPPRYELTVWG